MTHRAKKTLAGVLVALVVVGVAAAWFFARPLSAESSDSAAGIVVVQPAGAAGAGSQADAGEAADAEFITVSVASRMRLSNDGSQLRVNFIVPEGNDGLSERLEVRQGDRVVCSTGVLAPGEELEWAPASGAREGEATAVVHAVDEGGADSGNPVMAGVKVTAAVG